MAWRWYFSVVDPTTQASAGGSASVSLYIEYADEPGGVFSVHGSSLVPAAMSASCVDQGMGKTEFA